MKRIYIKPETTVQAVVVESIMQSLSGVSGSGMNYGGIDTDGTKSMDSKERDWEEI